jgi:hypothetical protein
MVKDGKEKRRTKRTKERAELVHEKLRRRRKINEKRIEEP